ncbi:chitobiase/beta-hexosaminidase C-terminal domain-containing protein [Pendulispora brunnea]|uniref:Chitobiase/beta-hexosaminidase C-terminal domain-containing protein n=1 Tax=Pendulispora brunnea TaxID=2905690 RepID=A0ABZ2K246_9BACT
MTCGGGVVRRYGAWLGLFVGLFVVIGTTGCSGNSAEYSFEPDGGAPDGAPAQQVAAPEFEPGGGSYASAQKVVLRTATAGAVIHYTLDGTTPSADSPAYAGPLAIAKTTTVKAFARKSGATDSEVRTATYTIDVPPGTVEPVQLEPNSGDYSNDVAVHLSSGTANATLCYALDGTPPACDATGRCAEHATAYTEPVAITRTGRQIRALACKKGMIASSEAQATYTLTAAKPTFTPASGSNEPSKLTIATETRAGAIHYTVNGGTPDCKTPDSFIDSGTFPSVFADATTVKALTCKEGYAPSEVVTANYLGAVCNGDYYVGERPQLEALAHCQTINGSLTIRRLDAPDLAPLANLAQVNGPLTIESTYTLRSLHGLESLRSARFLTVLWNHGLNSLEGLQGLTSVENAFVLDYNESLTTLHGLEALVHVGGNFSITGNASLTNLEGIASLQTVDGALIVGFNALPEWIGPASLVKVGGLYISNEPKLLRVGGFPALAEVGGQLQVVANDALTTFAEMPALTAIRDGAMFSLNPKLHAVSGFPKLRDLGGLSLVLNDSLTRFAAFPELTAIHGDVVIARNPVLMVLDIQSVQTIGGILNLRDLPGLSSLRGLGGLTEVQGWFMAFSGELGFVDLHGLERLKSVQGLLQIGPSTGLSDLQGLNGLTAVGYLDVVENKHLQTLRGLEKLESVPGTPGQSIRIYANEALTEIGALNSIVSLQQPLEINGNRSLTHFNGLHGLKSADFIYVTINQAMSKLDGLDALTHTSRDLRIVANGLTSLDDLHSLTEVGGSLIISEEALASMRGLGSLTSIGGELSISSCKTLPTLTGLGSLRSIGGLLSIAYNDALTSIDDLGQLTQLGGPFTVWDNRALPPCQPESLAAKLQALGYTGTITIQNNGGTGTCGVAGLRPRLRPPPRLQDAF